MIILKRAMTKQPCYRMNNCQNMIYWQCISFLFKIHWWVNAKVKVAKYVCFIYQEFSRYRLFHKSNKYHHEKENMALF
jgi:hypothetical protein